MNIHSVSTPPLSNMAVPNKSTPPGASETTDVQLAKNETAAQQSLLPAKEVTASRDELDKAVQAVTDFVNSVNSSLRFSIDGDTGKAVVKVIDKDTEEVIKQFPSEEMLAIAKALDDIKGLLVHQKA